MRAELLLVVLLIIFFIFFPWFIFSKTLSSGDWPYIYPENIKEFSFLPASPFLWLVPYYQISAKLFVEYFGFSWHAAEKILWFWPFLILSIISSFYLTRSWIGVLIYTVSTYPLMLVGGGQMGVALAYSLAPFVLALFIKLIDIFTFSDEKIKNQKSKIKIIAQNLKFLKKLIIVGLVLAGQMMFDPRITYITFIAVFVYFILKSNKKEIVVNSLILIIPILISLLLNSFWIISLLKYGFPSTYEGYSSILGFQFLSFADFSHSLSLLHPNWPENIFGKVYFMRPEFILLPILAYSSLLLISSKFNPSTKLRARVQSSKLQLEIQNLNNNSTILFFALIGLIGAFLAKGANPPFGQVNEFLFQYFPGMNMFRDATKFYLLIILSYSVLIPFSIFSIQTWLISKLKSQNSKLQFKTQNFKNNLVNELFSNIVIFSFFIFYLLFLIPPAVLGQLSGTFKPAEVPYEYIQLKNFLHNRSDVFKTLWIPEKQRFGFSSAIHPSINAREFFDTNIISNIIKEFGKKNIEAKLKDSSIKYIIIPYDSKREIFLRDRKYNEEDYAFAVKNLESMAWLKKNISFNKIAVFEVIY